MFSKNKKLKVAIDGMSCEHCSKKVEKELLEIANIQKVKISLKDKYALIFYKDNIDKNEIKNKINNLDYKVISINEI
mgnify:CR=1 FL=1